MVFKQLWFKLELSRNWLKTIQIRRLIKLGLLKPCCLICLKLKLNSLRLHRVFQTTEICNRKRNWIQCNMNAQTRVQQTKVLDYLRISELFQKNYQGISNIAYCFEIFKMNHDVSMHWCRKANEAKPKRTINRGASTNKHNFFILFLLKCL